MSEFEITPSEATTRARELMGALVHAFRLGTLEDRRESGVMDVAGLVLAGATGARGVLTKEDFMSLCEWCWEVVQ